MEPASRLSGLTHGCRCTGMQPFIHHFRKNLMKRFNVFHATVFSIGIVAAAATSTQALAQVSVNITIAPPSPLYEAVPVMGPGYVWAPGYWAWHGDRHIWVHGRSIVQRSGYRWEPDRWDQRNSAYYQTPGHWQRDGYLVVTPQRKPPKYKEHNGNGKGNGNKNKNEHGRQQDH